MKLAALYATRNSLIVTAIAIFLSMILFAGVGRFHLTPTTIAWFRLSRPELFSDFSILLRAVGITYVWAFVFTAIEFLIFPRSPGGKSSLLWVFPLVLCAATISFAMSGLYELNPDLHLQSEDRLSFLRCASFTITVAVIVSGVLGTITKALRALILPN